MVFGLRLGLACEHQGDHPGDHRRGLRGAGELAVVGALDAGFRMLDEKPAARPQQADHVAARGDHLRLDETFDGGAGRGEGGHPVVVPVGRGVVVGHRADGDHVGHVARHADGQRIGTAVAGRGDHDAGRHAFITAWLSGSSQ